MKTTVVNKYKQQYDIYIGRGSVWGNPFIIGRDGTREEVIEKYRKWIETQPVLLSKIHLLKGKRLGCFCKPLKCHGDILARLADGAEHLNVSDKRIEK